MPQLPINRPAYVTFEVKGVEKQRPREEGGALYIEEEDWVKITPQGSKDIVEKKVSDWLSTIGKRVEMQMEDPELLAKYQSAYNGWKTGQEIPVEGTPLKNWPMITKAQLALCLGLQIRTVEDLATSNAEAIHRLGMGAQVLRNRAVDWVEGQKGTGTLVTQVESLRATVNDLIETVKFLKDQNRVLKSAKGIEPAPSFHGSVTDNAGPARPESTLVADISDAIDAEMGA